MTKTRPIPEFPDYAITPTGEVYKTTVNPPRLVKHHHSTNGRTDRTHANVRLMVGGRQHRRGVKALVKAVWGDGL